MENEVKPWHLLMFTALVAFMIYMIYDKPQIAYDNLKTNCKEDSLKNVITELEIKLKNSEDDSDKKETRYGEILFEYEYGIESLKETHPDAYKKFHRILAFKENYTTQDERDNKKRLEF